MEELAHQLPSGISIFAIAAIMAAIATRTCLLGSEPKRCRSIVFAAFRILSGSFRQKRPIFRRRRIAASCRILSSGQRSIWISIGCSVPFIHPSTITPLMNEPKDGKKKGRKEEEKELTPTL